MFFVLAATVRLVVGRRHPGREEPVLDAADDGEDSLT